MRVVLFIRKIAIVLLVLILRFSVCFNFGGHYSVDWTTGLTFDLNFKVAVDSKAPQFVGEG